MSIVKITDKQVLDELVARITLRLGQRPTQQEVLDNCIKIAAMHFDELISRVHPVPVIDQDKFDKILEMREELSKIKWYPAGRGGFINDDDADVYQA